MHNLVDYGIACNRIKEGRLFLVWLLDCLMRGIKTADQDRWTNHDDVNGPYPCGHINNYIHVIQLVEHA